MSKKNRRDFLNTAAAGFGAAVIASPLDIEANAQTRTTSSSTPTLTINRPNTARVAFVIHGGAGAMARGSMTAQIEKAYRDKLTEAVTAGHEILKAGGASLDAVERAIRLLEDSPLFNAGKGAVFTSAGTIELDASIMDGSNLKAGAVAGIKTVRNPITLARRVMDSSRHVMMVANGAETFAREQKLEIVPNTYFHTEPRRQDLERIKQRERTNANQPANQPSPNRGAGQKQSQSNYRDENIFSHDDLSVDYKYGTVGACALDAQGNLAAGTSTGGITNKRFGRVGDAPIIGAGTYANNNTVAVSATGDGEYFIRSCVAHDLSALIEYRGLSVANAAEAVIEKVGKLGGGGGLIALDKQGNITTPFNSAGMYRAAIGTDGKISVAIYKD